MLCLFLVKQTRIGDFHYVTHQNRSYEIFRRYGTHRPFIMNAVLGKKWGSMITLSIRRKMSDMPYTKTRSLEDFLYAISFAFPFIENGAQGTGGNQKAFGTSICFYPFIYCQLLRKSLRFLQVLIVGTRSIGQKLNQERNREELQAIAATGLQGDFFACQESHSMSSVESMWRSGKIGGKLFYHSGD